MPPGLGRENSWARWSQVLRLKTKTCDCRRIMWPKTRYSCVRSRSKHICVRSALKGWWCGANLDSAAYIEQLIIGIGILALWRICTITIVAEVYKPEESNHVFSWQFDVFFGWFWSCLICCLGLVFWFSVSFFSWTLFRTVLLTLTSLYIQLMFTLLQKKRKEKEIEMQPELWHCWSHHAILWPSQIILIRPRGLRIWVGKHIYKVKRS